MPEEKNAVAVVMMNKTEAKATRDKIHQHVGATAALVMEFYKREGWRALGYKNWTECAKKEFGHGRARVYQLLDEAKVAEELKDATGSVPALSGRALQELKNVPPGKRAEAAAAVEKEHGPKASAAKVKSTVKKNSAWAPSGVSKKKKAAKPESIADQAKDDEKLQKPLAVLGGTCGRPFRKALEEGTIELSKADIIHLSEQDDETMIQAEKLISVNRWTLKRALSFLNDMPTLQTKLEQLTWHAVASPDDEWEGTFGAFTVTVKVNRRKL